MAELVGGAFLSSFLNVLFDRLSSPEVVNWIRGKKLDQKLLGRLETILYVVQAVLNDAERKQVTDPAVKKWLESLEDAVYGADDLLDELSTKAATQKDRPAGTLCCLTQFRICMFNPQAEASCLHKGIHCGASNIESLADMINKGRNVRYEGKKDRRHHVERNSSKFLMGFSLPGNGKMGASLEKGMTVPKEVVKKPNVIVIEISN